jgi:serine protease
MPTRLSALLLTAALAGGLAVPATAAAQDAVPGEVVVQHDGAAEPQVLELPAGKSVPEAIRDLKQDPDVRYAVPNVIAHASGFIPNDPGRGGPGGWQAIQWNFLQPVGVNAPDGWSNLIAAGAPGGRGAVVAVLDTGVAFATRGRFLRSPDFSASQFVPGYDFVDHDPRPFDENGHGTFVAGVIGERVNNHRALTGIAYGAKIMPVRVLDDQGLGDAAAIAAGIRWAARHKAQVINLSLEFDTSVPASQIPEVLSAIRYANRRGVLVVGAAGNEALRIIAYPARANGVLSVGATTEHLCQADYSNDGRDLDMVAPGGGADASIDDDPHCRPAGRPGRDIFQLTFVTSPKHFGLPGGFEGTSMAAPHISAVAALVIASGVIGRHPSPKAIQARLETTARDVGAPGPDLRYGWGLVDAGAATTPSPQLRAAWRRAAARRAAARR